MEVPREEEVVVVFGVGEALERDALRDDDVAGDELGDGRGVGVVMGVPGRG